jgi:parvulin-like peptidyl-prolyl isomerase
MIAQRVLRPVLRSRAVSTRTAKTIIALLSALTASFALAACGGGGSGGDKSLGPDAAVAIQVGAETITNADIERRAMFLSTNPTSSQAVTVPAKDSKEFKEFRLQAAQQLRDERVFGILAKQCGKDCAVTEKEIEKQLTDIQDQQFAGSAAEFNTALQTRGITRADLRKSLKASQQEQRLTAREQDKVVYTDKEGLAYYNKNIARYKLVAEKRISHILVKTKSEAVAIRAEATPANFAALARSKSIDPAAKKPDGEDLGAITGGGLLPELAALAQQLKPNQISPPVQSQFGWHILLMRQVKARTKTYAEVKGEIRAQELQIKQAAAVQTWRDTVVKKLQDTAKYLNAKVAPAAPAAAATTPSTKSTTTTAPTTKSATPTATVTSGATTGPATP